MILPIYAFGQRVLKALAKPISKDYPNLEDLISNMWETMYNAKGVGLAAPQVGLPIRLFLIDSVQLNNEGTENEGIKKAFINAKIVEETGKPWAYEEGCLSIPQVHGDVIRQPKIKIQYFDESFNEIIEEFEGMDARIIQHEYDHIDGILFTELLKPIKKQRIKRKLDKIKSGNISTDYPMRFARF